MPIYFSKESINLLKGKNIGHDNIREFVTLIDRKDKTIQFDITHLNALIKFINDKNSVAENPEPKIQDQTKECVVCMEEDKNTVLLPCRHLCVCQTCFPNIENVCPMCREVVKDTLIIY